MKGATTTTRSRKRQRQSTNTSHTTNINTNANNSNVTTVTIPGIPASTIPLLLEAVKARKRYLSKVPLPLQRNQQQQQQQQQYNQQQDLHSNNHDDSKVVKGILQRIQTEEQRSKEQQQHQKHAPYESLRESSHVALSHLLQNLNVNRNENSPSSSFSSLHTSKQSSSSSSSSSNCVAVSCLTFLLDTMQDPSSKPILRRAALFVISHLLYRNSDCRSYLAFASSNHHSNPNDNANHGGGTGNLVLMDLLSSSSLHHHHATTNSVHTVQLQREMVQFISNLAKRYGGHHPKWIVAARMLRENYGLLHHSHSSTLVHNDGNDDGFHQDTDHVNGQGQSGSTMMQLRRTRDIALIRAEKECRRIQILVRSAHVCFDALVPRFGYDAHDDDDDDTHNDGGHVDTKNHDMKWKAMQMKNEGKNQNVQDQEEEDEDGVDWEDGDDIQNETIQKQDETKQDDTDEKVTMSNTVHTTNSIMHNDSSVPVPSNTNHAAQVERTLQVMKTTGALFGGTLDICFGKHLDSDDEDDHDYGNGKQRHNNNQHNSTPMDGNETSDTTTLQNCVNRLSKKHLPRLSRWIYALQLADGMVVQQQQPGTNHKAANGGGGNDGDGGNRDYGTSLVLASTVVRERWGVVLEMLLDARRNVRQVLASAARLGILTRSDDHRDGVGNHHVPGGGGGDDDVAENNVFESNGVNAPSSTGQFHPNLNRQPLPKFNVWQNLGGIERTAGGGNGTTVKERLRCKIGRRRPVSNGGGTSSTKKNKQVQVRLRKS